MLYFIAEKKGILEGFWLSKSKTVYIKGKRGLSGTATGQQIFLTETEAKIALPDKKHSIFGVECTLNDLYSKDNCLFLMIELAKIVLLEKIDWDNY